MGVKQLGSFAQSKRLSELFALSMGESGPLWFTVVDRKHHLGSGHLPERKKRTSVKNKEENKTAHSVTNSLNKQAMQPSNQAGNALIDRPSHSPTIWTNQPTDESKQTRIRSYSQLIENYSDSLD